MFYFFVVIGNGYYIYIESSSGRSLDKARLWSPPLNGTKCMTFHYNFYGSTMSCVVISMKTMNGSEKIVWVKSGHWGDRWIKAQIEITEEKSEYQVCIKILFDNPLYDIAMWNIKQCRDFYRQTCLFIPSLFRMASRDLSSHHYKLCFAGHLLVCRNARLGD